MVRRYLYLLLQTLKYTLNTLLGAFRQATPLISKKVRLFPPHMVFTKKKPWNRKASVHRQNINSSENSLPAPVAKAEANRLGKAARLNLSFKGTPTTRHGGYLCAPLTSQKPPRCWVAQIFLSISSWNRNRPKVMQRLSIINNNKTIPWPWPASNVHLAKMCFSHQVQLSNTRQKKSIDLSDPQKAFSDAF